MRILAIGQLTGPDIQPHLDEERRTSAQLHEEGFIVQSFRKRDRSGAILLVEAADAAAARSGLEKLPFVERDLIAFDLIELADDE